MLTEERARELLARAAETIEVAPASGLPPHRRRTPLLLAFAAVLVLVAGLSGFVVVTLHGRQGDSTALDPSGASATMGVVPAVVGEDVRAAKRTLADAGFDVRIDITERCGLVEDRATATEPTPGTSVAEGSTVTLRYDEPGPTMDCAYTPEARAWDFLDWARGAGADERRPRTAAWVQILGVTPARTVREADPPSAWPRATAIAQAAVSLVPYGTGRVQPRLVATDTNCGRTEGGCTGWTTRVELRLGNDESPYAAFELRFDRDYHIVAYEVLTPPAGPASPPSSP